MAGFVTDDGKGGISGDTYVRKVQRPVDVDKMKQPPGPINSRRLLNTNMYDLLVHIQQSLSMNNRCILELITNESHSCLKMNDTIQRRIRQFALSYIDDDFRKSYPRSTFRYKVPGRETYATREETDEEWDDRLCHMYMHINHPYKLQMIQCEECLQHWMNSDKW